MGGAGLVPCAEPHLEASAVQIRHLEKLRNPWDTKRLSTDARKSQAKPPQTMGNLQGCLRIPKQTNHNPVLLCFVASSSLLEDGLGPSSSNMSFATPARVGTSGAWAANAKGERRTLTKARNASAMWNAVNAMITLLHLAECWRDQLPILDRRAHLRIVQHKKYSTSSMLISQQARMSEVSCSAPVPFG